MKFYQKAALALLATVPMLATPVVINPSFETGPAPGVFTTLAGGDTSITGWTVNGDSIDYIGSYWVAADGSRSLDLNGNGQGGIQQTVNGFDIGTLYTLTFMMSGNPDRDQINTLRLSVSGIGFQDYTFDSSVATNANMGWVQYSFLFAATATTHTISFDSQDASAFGSALDNVGITGEVPEPATYAMMGGGLIALAFLRRRK